MSRRRANRTDRPRTPSRRAAHVVERVERRVLLSAAARFTPDPITGNAPTEFTWNIPAQGGQVLDFAHAQHGLYDAAAGNAVDEVFLKLTGIPGESTEAKHLGEIDVAGFEWGGDHVVAGPGPQFSELHVTAAVSKASPLLMQRAATGATIADADLVVRNAGGTQVEYYKVFLDDARVSSYRVNTGARGTTFDEFTLTFARARVEYRPPDLGAGPITFDWNVAQQGRGVEDFAPPQRQELHAPVVTGSDERFLRLDGIPGESDDGKHLNEIDLLSFDWSLDSVVTTAGAQPRFNEIHVTAFTSKASPLLMQRTASGASIASGDLTLRRSGGTQLDYYRLHLTDAHVSSYEVSTTQVAGRLVEEFTLRAGAINLDYVPADPITKHALPPVEFDWDLTDKETPTRGFAPTQRELIDAPSFLTPAPGPMFLRLDGIVGESPDVKHTGEIDIASFEWLADRAYAGDGTGEAGLRFGELHVASRVNRASPQLMSAAALGTLIPTGDFVVQRGELGTFYHVDLTNVRVGSYQVTTAPDGNAYEEYTLRFEATQVQYRPDLGGVLGAPITFTWSLPTDGGAIQAFAPAQRSLIDTPALLASNLSAFLRLDGIVGETTAAKHAGEIDVTGFEWGLHKPAGGGPEFFEIQFAADVNKASPQLMSKLVAGTAIPTGRLIVQRNGGAQVQFYRIDFTNAVVSSHVTSTGDGRGLREFFSLNVPAFSLQYVPVDPNSGLPIGSVTFGYDVAQSGGTVRDFTPAVRSIADRARGQHDMFLRLDGVTGDSTGAKHTNEIDVSAFEWVLDRTVGAAGAPFLAHLQFNAPLSRATPQLMQRLAQAAVSPTARFVVRRSGGDQREFYSINLANAVVSTELSSSAMTPAAARGVGDSFTLGFLNAAATYVPVDPISGLPQTPVTFNFDGGQPSWSSGATPHAQRALLEVAPATAAPPGLNLLLQLDGIAGESTVGKHVGEIDLRGFEWSMHNPQTGGPRFAELHVVARVNKSSPTVLQRLATSQGVAHGKLTVQSASTGRDFFTIDLDGVIVSAQRFTTAPTGEVLEEYTLSFDHFDDIAPPQLVSSEFRYQTAPHELRFRFDDDVAASLGNDDITVQRVGGGTVPVSLFGYDPATNTATFRFADGVIPDGRYRATLAGDGITDDSGNLLQANPTLDFFFFMADANHDASVNLIDFNALAANFGQSSRDFTQGDFSYDGIVNLVDFNILAARFGAVLPGSPADGSLDESEDEAEEDLPDLPA